MAYIIIYTENPEPVIEELTDLAVVSNLRRITAVLDVAAGVNHLSTNLDQVIWFDEVIGVADRE